MKKIQKSAIALSVSLLALGYMSSAQAASEEVKKQDEVSASSTDKKSDVKPVVKKEGSVEKANAENKKEKEKEKEKKPKFEMSKASAYQQLAFDLRKHGYRLSWDIKQDFPFTAEKFDTWQEETLAVVDTVNKARGLTEESNYFARALVCPKSSYVVITTNFSAYGVVDKDKRSCNLLRAVKDDEEESSPSEPAYTNAGYMAYSSSNVSIPSSANDVPDANTSAPQEGGAVIPPPDFNFEK